MISAEVLAVRTGTTVEQARQRIKRYGRTFLSMRPFLPETCADFLDIGCGIGGVAMLVARHYPTATAHLIDGEAEGERYSYRPDGKPWASVGVALRLFAGHMPGRTVRAWPPDPALTVPCELIYSNCSWGHHFAIDTYLGLARRSLRPSGILITDLRRREIGEHGRDALRTCFEHVADIPEAGKKYVRTVWRAAA